jgi:uncharacterized damage-inducible protein DinB
MQNNNQVQLLKWMLDDVRQETLKGIQGLDKEQLFKPPVNGEYPVGSYILHLAECEIHWLQRMTGEKTGEDLKEKIYFDKWFDPSGEAAPPDEAPDVEYYHQMLYEARKIVNDTLDNMTDEDLNDDVKWKWGETEYSRSKKWIIYHLIEHEAHHRGQMFMLMRMGGMLKNKN